MIRDRPADDAARGGVDHSRQVDLALSGRVLGDIADPEGIRSVDCELAVHEVVRERGFGVAPGGEVLLPSIDPLETGLSHQALDTLFADVDTLAQDELGMHARAAIGAP